MEYIRQVINSNELQNITLPSNFAGRKIEVIIYPFEESDKEVAKNPKKGLDNIVGIFSDVANPKLVSLEKEAWGKAMEEKYGFS